MGENFIKKVGNYYIYYRSPTSACTADKVGDDLQLKLIHEISTALKNCPVDQQH